MGFFIISCTFVSAKVPKPFVAVLLQVFKVRFAQRGKVFPLLDHDILHAKDVPLFCFIHFSKLLQKETNKNAFLFQYSQDLIFPD